MKQNLQYLIELQKVDNELQALRELLGDLPQTVEKLQAELEALRQEHAARKSELEELIRTRATLEGDVEVFKDKLKKYQDQLYAVTTNREYDAITVEIDEMKTRIDESETRLLELIEQEEKLGATLQDLEAQIESYETDLQKKREELEEKTRATEDEYRVWENKREELASRLSKPVLYQYERIRKVRRDTAVVPVNKYACSGCYSAIPPQKVMEIRNMDQLIMCESCGRILIYENQDVAVAH